MFFNFSDAGGDTVGLLNCQNGAANPAYLLFYSDIEGSGTDWNTIYQEDSLSCEERTARAHLVVPLELGVVNAQEQLGITPSAVPHYWFVAVSSCGYNSMAASARIEFLNAGWENPSMTAQFSFDDQVVEL
jgi:hypothetical protein